MQLYVISIEDKHEQYPYVDGKYSIFSEDKHEIILYKLLYQWFVQNK